MSGAPFDRRLYFGSLAVLLLEANDLEADILTQILTGFKVRSVTRFVATEEALKRARSAGPDMVVAGSALVAGDRPDEYEFIRMLRQGKQDEAARAPVILLSGHTSQANVMRARDCGASVVVAKPIKAQLLYDRLVWLASDARPFISCPTYNGPDRRFQSLGPPPFTEGRRKGDLSLKLGEAKAPNMSQSEIDALLNGKGAPRT